MMDLRERLLMEQFRRLCLEHMLMFAPEINEVIVLSKNEFSVRYTITLQSRSAIFKQREIGSKPLVQRALF